MVQIAFSSFHVISQPEKAIGSRLRVSSLAS
jgi:hypothetical protein